MPIRYKVYYGGNLVHVIIRETVTDEDIAKLRKTISRDERINSHASRLIEVMDGSSLNESPDDVMRKLRQRIQLIKRTGFMCAIYVSYKDNKAWELGDFFRKIYEIYEPFSVVLIFADLKTAKRWLGFDEDEFTEPEIA